MSTTAILLEFLLSGLQAALWLVLLILTFFEIGWSSLDNIKGFESMVTVVLLPFVYPLGVFADNLADYCLKGWNGKIRQKHINDQNYSAFRLLITTGCRLCRVRYRRWVYISRHLVVVSSD